MNLVYFCQSLPPVKAPRLLYYLNDCTITGVLRGVQMNTPLKCFISYYIKYHQERYNLKFIIPKAHIFRTLKAYFEV